MAPEPDRQPDRDQPDRNKRDRDQRDRDKPDRDQRDDEPVTGEADLVPEPDVALEADDSFTA